LIVRKVAPRAGTAPGHSLTHGNDRRGWIKMLSVRKTEEDDDSETVNDGLAAPVFDFVV
jgi:hypothetical protein